eukprot:TRINITY_DN1131_c0_g1_i1.p1 TRINITY_DN1131_c0_g1~~TRINITY_DN1131_c0_g1_i1.p1  ORF type:complete len:475 (+),score=90.57 TRINITY_DN1131_c0_g1_i1:29-1426(+)
MYQDDLEQPLITPSVYENSYATPVPIFHPTRALYRYTLLLIISLICFGSYFTYDEIQPTDYLLKFNGYLGHPNDTQSSEKFTLLYSVYSFPNTILVFFGGIVGDKIGLRLSGLIFVTLCLIGAVLVALGSQLIGVLTPATGYIITVAGRVVFGCGAESLNVIQNAMISRWFSGGRELAFAMGLALSISRLGDFLALSVTSSIAHKMGSFDWILWGGAILIAISLGSVLIYSVMDKASERFFPNRVVDPTENQLNFRAVLRFDLRFWLIAIACLSYYGGIFPFISILGHFLTAAYGMENAETVSWYSSVITLASMCLSPFLGKFLDIVARRPYFVVFGSMVVIPCHIWMALKLQYPLIPIILIGLSFSLVPSALWPSVPLIIRPREVATAFGVMAAIQNSGLTAINAISGLFDYRVVMWFFVGMDCVGLIAAILLVIVDRARGSILVTPDVQRALAARQAQGLINS